MFDKKAIEKYLEKKWYIPLLVIVAVIVFIVIGCVNRSTDSEPVTEKEEPKIETTVIEKVAEVAQTVETTTIVVEKTPEVVPEVKEEPKNEFEVKSKTYEYLGHTMTVTEYETYTVVDYPSFVQNSEVLDFFAYELGRYPFLNGNCYYEFGNHCVTLTYPSGIVALDYADSLAAEILAYINGLFKETLVAEEPKAEPAEEKKEETKPEPETVVTPSAKKEKVGGFEILPMVSPYNVQLINYSDDDSTIVSDWGMGVGVDGLYHINNWLSVDTRLFLEYHTFPDLYNYFDFKFDPRVRAETFSFGENDAFSFNLSLGAGVDFVFRNDGDFGAYVLFNAGLDLEYMYQDGLALRAGVDCGLTLQKGSQVLQLVPYVGCTFNLNADRRTK